MADKYYEYFDIDENYFPCIDDSAINAGAPWDNTYPHETFIKLLKSVESMLARTNNKRSVWIHGAYGTGKSQCAHALKKILEVPKKELEEYWNKYEPLKKEHDLLQKLLGHKDKNIVTAYRYASGSINSDRDLLFAVQNSVKDALIANGIKYTGEKTLKDSVIAWIDEPTHKDFFDKLLQKPEYSGKFSQSSADEVLNALRKGGDIKELMDNIFYLAGREGITALTLDTDRLIAWLKDIIDQNDIRIVLVWDEFSAYFKKNRGALDEFQKLVALCQEKPFYFIVVTHQTSGLIADNDPSWTVPRQRFDFTEITLPDNIAFNLIKHAFNAKSAAKPVWDTKADELNSRLDASRKAVSESARITDQDVIKGIMPIHPMAALILKNIAAAFESNQRSMFDFIKTSNTDDVKAFQWFIKTTGPEDDHPLLTVDLLWNFFYEKGRNNLTADIQAILDTYPRQQNLRLEEQAVLKTILIMQAIDQRLGGTVDLFKVTDRNLDLVFEGIPDLEKPRCGAVAKKLVHDDVLYKKPIGNNIEVYAAVAIAGDQAKIDRHKENLRKTTTAKLVSEGGLAGVLNLTPALKLRFETEAGTGKLHAVTMADFTRTINGLRDKAAEKSWRFYSVIAFAKDEGEQVAFRKLIKEAAQNKEYENILFIDALSTPLGGESFEEYVGYSALAMYYNGNENELSKDNNNKAKRILDTDWNNRIGEGQFIVYSYDNPEGDKYPNGQAVLGALQSEVMKRYPLTFDFTKGLTENMLKLTQGPNSAKSGLTQSSSGAVVGIEKHILTTVWRVDEYWKHQPTLPISKIKIRINAIIESAFAVGGQISVRQIYDILTNEFGFAPCNMSAFLAGFLLKEYAYERNPYRYMDSQNGHESMTSNIMGDMLGNYIGTHIDTSKAAKYKDTYLVKMTAEEMAFYALTEKAFKLTKNQCTSPGQAAQLVRTKMQALGLPVWCLAEIDDDCVFDVIEQYMDFVPSEGKDTHNKAMEIGKIAIAKPSLGDTLATFLTKENCQKGMRKFLKRFEGGKIPELAREIGAEDNMLEDIHSLFNVKYSGYWDKSMGEVEICKLLTEYGIILESNGILDTNANSLNKCFSDWRERLKFVPISCESLETINPSLGKSLDYIQKIYKQDDFLPVDLVNFHNELKAQGQAVRNLLNDMAKTFEKTYEPYLEGLSESDIDNVRSKVPIGMFTLSKTECNAKVKEQAEIYRKGQLKTKLHTLWKEKSGAATPKKWSSDYTMPILCMVSPKEFEAAKKTFDTLSRTSPSDAEIQAAIEFLETASFLADLGDQAKRLTAFQREIIGEYATMLTDTAKVQEELDRKLSIDPYEWYANPNVKQMIQRMAKNEYDAGGSDKALEKIDGMDDATLKDYLKRLVKENMTVGIEIIGSGGQ
jgi:hypothetical protein